MKTFYLIAIIFYSCSNKVYRQQINVYKDRAFCKCIASGLYLDSKRESELVAFNPWAIAFYDNQINASLVFIRQKLKSDSIERKLTVAEPAANKQVFKFCNEYYKSAELNKMAKMKIKEVLKIKSPEDSIQKAIPSF